MGDTTRRDEYTECEVGKASGEGYHKLMFVWGFF